MWHAVQFPIHSTNRPLPRQQQPPRFLVSKNRSAGFCPFPRSLSSLSRARSREYHAIRTGPACVLCRKDLLYSSAKNGNCVIPAWRTVSSKVWSISYAARYVPVPVSLTSKIGGMAGKLIEYPFDTVKACCPTTMLILRFVYKPKRM